MFKRIKRLEEQGLYQHNRIDSLEQRVKTLERLHPCYEDVHMRMNALILEYLEFEVKRLEGYNLILKERPDESQLH